MTKTREQLQQELGLIREAEANIQRILLQLQEQVGCRLDHVEVDTRRFGDCTTEISLRT